MKKALAILLSALIVVSLFISCVPAPKVEIKISFSGNGGGGTMADVTTYAGEATDLPPNTFVKEGWYFDGWNTDPNGHGKWYHDTEIVRFNENTTLYAQWHEFGPTIAFHANGGEGTMRHQHVIKDTYVHLEKNKYTLKDHVFMGWNTEKDGSGTSYKDEALFKTDKNVILYAQWAILITPDTRQWEDGNVYSLGTDDVTITDKILVFGNVTLILPEGRTLTSKCGINVSKGNSLTIKGDGKLDVNGILGQAGIGGCEEETCGDITIEGGKIYVLGGANAAGIGGGIGGGGGNVTITGGTVTAIAGNDDYEIGSTGNGIGRGAKEDGKQKLSDGNLTVENVTLWHSDDGKSYVPYEGKDYSKRYHYMEAQ